MFQLFPTATPEEVGIDSQWLMNFCKRLEEQQLPPLVPYVCPLIYAARKGVHGNLL